MPIKLHFALFPPPDQTSKLKYILQDARFFLIKSNNHENVSLAKAKVCHIALTDYFHYEDKALIAEYGIGAIVLLIIKPFISSLTSTLSQRNRIS